MGRIKRWSTWHPNRYPINRICEIDGCCLDSKQRHLENLTSQTAPGMKTYPLYKITTAGIAWRVPGSYVAFKARLCQCSIIDITDFGRRNRIQEHPERFLKVISVIVWYSCNKYEIYFHPKDSIAEYHNPCPSGDLMRMGHSWFGWSKCKSKEHRSNSGMYR